MSFLPTRDIWDLDKLPTVVQTSYPADRKCRLKLQTLTIFTDIWKMEMGDTNGPTGTIPDTQLRK